MNSKNYVLNMLVANPMAVTNAMVRKAMVATEVGLGVVVGMTGEKYTVELTGGERVLLSTLGRVLQRNVGVLPPAPKNLFDPKNFEAMSLMPSRFTVRGYTGSVNTYFVADQMDGRHYWTTVRDNAKRFGRAEAFSFMTSILRGEVSLKDFSRKSVHAVRIAVVDEEDGKEQK